MTNSLLNNNILIVDDQKKNLIVISTLLKENGYASQQAISGQQALELINEYSFDLILLDIMMPKMSGFELCKILKENPATKDIPIIFITAKSDYTNIAKGLNLGAMDYISKPFNPSELLARVENQLKLRNALLELEYANKTKDKFFSIIAHDLRNPIGSFLNISDYLNSHLENIPPNELKDFISEINSASKNLHNLLENLLEWSRSQIGTIPFSPDYLVPASLVDNNIAILGLSASSKNICITNNVNPELTAFADVNMITTVLRNLISNSIKFTPKGGFININAEPYNENLIQLSVTDNGVGMPQDKIDSLFRIDSYTSSPGTNNELGSGLGLIICKEFVSRNSGSISVSSVPNSNTTFSFTIPAFKP